ncbi:MAG: cell division protein FtsZ [Alphaproteobacteria bacterium]|nr:cell division protein FtsZ [Alphaproteobacteria bacterium]
MPVKLAVPETNMITLKPRISVIGVGGGGGNAVNNMIVKKLEGVDFIVANTDAQALENSKCDRRIQLGIETTHGLGAGACPEIGRAAAEEAQAEIEKELEGANMVFITAGMGGGTGSGAAPVVARIAKQKGILTIGVITKPFQFEGKKRSEIAEKAVEEFISAVDSIIIIPNQNLFRVADKTTTLADAFVLADNVLYSGVRSITDLMMMPGLINLDFADIKSIMQDKGKAIMGTGEAEGEGRALQAAEQALSNPLLDNSNMTGAKGVLINITGGNDLTLFEIDEAANRIKEEVDEDANIIFGSSFDDSLNGKIRVSIVATGIDNSRMPKAKPATPISTNYLEESYSPSTSVPNTPNDELDSNLAKFAANIAPESIVEENVIVDDASYTSPVVEETAEQPVAENQEPIAVIDDLETSDADASNSDNSAVITEIPQASSLFSAVINKTEHNDVDSQLESALSAQSNSFSSKNAPKFTEEEPELFANNPQVFTPAPKVEENEKLIVNETTEYTPTLIERFTGFSIAKRNLKKKMEQERHYQEPVTPAMAGNDDDDRNNLDIPSFLRRK